MLIEFLYGTGNTLLLAGIAWVVGLPLGILLSFKSLQNRIISIYLNRSAIVLTIIPFLAVLYWLHYPLQEILDVVWPPFFTSSMFLTIFIMLTTGEIIASQMRNLKSDYIDAANVLGLSIQNFIRKIVYPSALRNSLPRLINLSVVSIHMTMFSSLIGVEELFRVSLRINADILDPVRVFSIMGAIYASICLPLYGLEFYISKRLKGFQDA